jgi:hypothetical protein
MATGYIIVTVVDVGQGQCTFVEIYNTASTPKLIGALLFDCGSDKPSDETYTNLDYIASQALKLDTPGFDCIFFSHSDKDHISLTKYVLNKINETKKPTVQKVVYGGAQKNYTKYGFNILDYIFEKGYCAKINIRSLPSNESSYDMKKKKYVNYIWKNSDNSVIVYAIAANVLSDDPDWDEDDGDLSGKTAEELNRVSLVCGLYFAAASFVICGDATSKTMSAIGKHYTVTSVFNNNKMTTTPHHGSRATGLAVPSSKIASDNAIEVVENFASVMKSKVMTVSAFSKHRHPSLELMNYFIPYVKGPILKDARIDKKNAHFITANIDIEVEIIPTSKGRKRPPSWTVSTGKDSSFESTINTFSTRYYDSAGTDFGYELGGASGDEAAGTNAAINEFACWKFTTSSGATTIVSGYVNLAAGSAFTSAPLGSTTSFAVIPDEDESMGLITAAKEMPLVLPRRPGKVRKAAASATAPYKHLKHFY